MRRKKHPAGALKSGRRSLSDQALAPLLPCSLVPCLLISRKHFRPAGQRNWPHSQSHLLVGKITRPKREKSRQSIQVADRNRRAAPANRPSSMTRPLNRPTSSTSSTTRTATARIKTTLSSSKMTRASRTIRGSKRPRDPSPRRAAAKTSRMKRRTNSAAKPRRNATGPDSSSPSVFRLSSKTPTVP